MPKIIKAGKVLTSNSLNGEIILSENIRKQNELDRIEKDALREGKITSVESQLADIARHNVKKYGAKGDGITDDTVSIQSAINDIATKGGGKLYFPIGVYNVGGELKDIAGANAQLVLPDIPAGGSEAKQITIEFVGEIAPPSIMYVITSGTPTPTNHVILKSTLTNGNIGNLIGGYSVNGVEHLTNILFRMENIALRTTSNPTLTALDLYNVCAVDLDNVIADTGTYNVLSLVEPTTASSFGIRLPRRYNGAHTRLGSVDVVGFYNGYLFGEHSNGQQVASWGCKNAFIFEGADHASKFQRLNTHHCQNNLIFTGQHFVDVDQLNIEHSDTLTWMATIYDVNDVSNFGQGLIRYSVVKANTGQDNTFSVNGGKNLSATHMFNKGKIWKSATYENGWSKHDTYGYNLQYKKDASGLVFIRGIVKGGTTGSVIFTLPIGYRPAVNLSFPAVAGGVSGTIDIMTDGSVGSSIALGNSAISLESIQFYTD